MFTLLLYKLPWAHVSIIQVLSPNALMFFSQLNKSFVRNGVVSATQI